MTLHRPKYCIIGAGAGGLTCARHALNTGAEVVVFEQTDRIGGTWVYTEQVGQDRNGLPIHTSMYRGLRSNIPKQTMGYPDSDIESNDSYVSQEEVLKWLMGYADKHDLSRLIKLEHQVIRVAPFRGDGDQWVVNVKDLRDNLFFTYKFDFIMVCNGHYSTPLIPEYPGSDQFKGLLMHSHDYRSEDRFKGHDVLLVGAGYSASDIAIATVKHAKSLVISHHNPEKVKFNFSSLIKIKPSISELMATGARFVDGTEINCTTIIFCTGYKYSFPFLSSECGIRIEENHVTPLFKHVINISHPTMALIGIPFYVCPTQMMDLQARFCIQFFTGALQLPGKEKMLRDMEADIEERRRRGLPKKSMHKLEGDLQPRYYDDLAKTAQVEPLKPIVMKLFDECMRRRAEDLLNYRNDKFVVTGDGHFRVL
ncbi:senecionine N-oxygenase-like [Topomyia yanbarensis]|uniref:senecionine N-oxygenase-like n=1 Tax=Topomyia yanbarensis TaxID=2498891 RepID=UPI00273C08BF|nr:senecionine N-oxygenase-like [Topomyia yanbarensis]